MLDALLCQIPLIWMGWIATIERAGVGPHLKWLGPLLRVPLEDRCNEVESGGGCRREVREPTKHIMISRLDYCFEEDGADARNVLKTGSILHNTPTLDDLLGFWAGCFPQ